MTFSEKIHMSVSHPLRSGKHESVIHAFQWELRSSLEHFLNSGWYRGKKDWSRLLKLFEIISGHSPSTRRSEIAIDSYLQARFIADCYVLWSYGIFPKRIVRTATTICAAFDPSNYKEAYLKHSLQRIADLFETGIEQCSFMGLHGSMSTLDYTPYSDIDTLAILTKDAAKDPDKLLKLRKTVRQVCSILYEYDPLQHHGVFFCTEYELEYYPEAFLPIAALQHSRHFRGPCTLEIAARDSLFEASQNFLRLSTTTLSLANKRPVWHVRANATHLKGTLSQFYLIPCLFLGAIGEFCYKRDSFPRVQRFLSPNARFKLNLLSEIRTNWDFPKVFGKMERMLQKTGLSPRKLRRIAGLTTDKLFLLKLRDLRASMDSITDVIAEFMTLYKSMEAKR